MNDFETHLYPPQQDLGSTTCPFCLYGCELSLKQISGITQVIEYLPKAKINQGRLCARGNAAPFVLNHKQRLAYPLYANREISWQKAKEILISNLKSCRQDEIAITFDKGLTKEEFNLVSELATKLGIVNFACSYLEPELYFSYILEDSQIGELADIEKAQVFILIGDVFGQTPVIAKSILNQRYADRTNRIFVIDSVPTHTAGFADKFLKCKPSTEPLVVLVLHSLVTGKIKGIELEQVAEVASVPAPDIEEVAKSLSNFNSGLIINAMNFGRQENPYLLSLAAQTLATKSGKRKFLGTGESVPWGLGKENFGSIFNKIKEGKIKVLINFGDYFPFYYPQIQTDLAKLDGFIATALFRPTHFKKGLFLPCPSNLEKDGIVKTLWGETKINKTMEPLSGSKMIAEIIEWLLIESSNKQKIDEAEKRKLVTVREVYEQAREYLNFKKQMSKATQNKTNELTLIGEKPAIGFLNIFDNEDIIKINSGDANRFKLKDHEPVKVVTENFETTLIVKTTGEIPEGIALVGANRIENRQLFKMVIDKATNNVIFPPTEVKVWRKE